MSVWATNCYRVASKGPRPSLSGRNAVTGSRRRAVVAASALTGPARVSACEGCGGALLDSPARSSHVPCGCCDRAIGRAASSSRRPASLDRFVARNPFPPHADPRTLSIWSPASSSSRDDRIIPLDVQSSQSLSEDLVTILQSYRYHLASVLLTQSRRRGRHRATPLDVLGTPLLSLSSDRRWSAPLNAPVGAVRPFHASAALAAAKEEGDAPKAVVPLSQKVKNIPAAIGRFPAAVKREIKHLYHGFHLLAIDIKIASRLTFQILRGKTLTRREKNMLVRTTADVFRLVPFLVFIVIPFMEFLLPFALKLFPNMLPSTFDTEDKKKEQQLKMLRAKVEMAKFLQQTLKGEGEEDKESLDVHDFLTFLKTAQTSGKPVKNEDILKYSALFENEITLDNLQRPQLIALCRLLELQPMGTNNFLRFQIRMQLRSLKADDRLIRNEGVEALAVWELQQASRARGMRALGLTETQLQNQLRQWLELHLDHKIPATLLLLSRIVYIGEGASLEAKLAGAMTQLAEQSTPLTQTIIKKEAEVKEKAPAVTPDVGADASAPPATTIVTPGSAKAAEPEPAQLDVLTKIELLRLEEEKIRLEREEARLRHEEAKRKIEEEERRMLTEQEQVLMDTAPTMEDAAPENVDKAPALTTGVAAPDTAPSMGDVAVPMNEASPVLAPRSETSRLQELNDQLDSLKTLSEQLKSEVAKDKSKASLDKKVNKMIDGMEKLIVKMHKERDKQADLLRKKAEVIETDEFKELDAERQAEAKEEMADSKQKVLTLDELVDAIHRIQAHPDEDRLHMIVDLLDQDKDGTINQEDVVRVLKLISRDPGHWTDARVAEVLRQVQRELQIDEEQQEQQQHQQQQQATSKQSDTDGKQPGSAEMSSEDSSVPKSTAEDVAEDRSATKISNANNKNTNENNNDEYEEDVEEKKTQRNA